MAKVPWRPVAVTYSVMWSLLLLSESWVILSRENPPLQQLGVLAALFFGLIALCMATKQIKEMAYTDLSGYFECFGHTGTLSCSVYAGAALLLCGALSSEL